MMSDIHPEPQPVSSAFENEYQDPHFHDEDLEIRSNDLDFDVERRALSALPGRKKPNRRPPPRRRFIDD